MSVSESALPASALPVDAAEPLAASAAAEPLVPAPPAPPAPAAPWPAGFVSPRSVLYAPAPAAPVSAGPTVGNTARAAPARGLLLPRGTGLLGQPLVVLGVLAVGLLLVLQAQRALVGQPLGFGLVAMYGLGLVLVAFLDHRARALAADEPALAGDTARVSRAVPRFLLALLGVGMAALWLLLRGHPATTDFTDAMVLWLATLALGTVAAAWPLRPAEWPARLRATIANAPLDWALALGIAVLALVLRLVWIEQQPYVMGGDEASQAMSAVGALEGTLKNPFGTGWYSLPTLPFFMYAGSMLAFGDSLFGVRALSAILGALTVLLTYLLARRLFGRTGAVLAALLLAAFHYHLLFSRLASVQIGDPLTLVAAMYLLDRGLFERRRLDCFLAGAVIGLSQYFSFGGRLIPLVALAYLGYLALRGGDALTGESPRQVWTARVRLVGWIGLGALLVFLPLLAHYADNPQAYNSRVDQVSMFSSGWLTREIASTGRGAFDLILWQIQRAALLPFHTVTSGWYTNVIPLASLPMAGFMAIGLAITTLCALQRRYVGLAAAYWGAVLGLGLTEDPTQTQRFVIAAPLMTLLVTVALLSLCRIVAVLVGVPRQFATGLVALLAVWFALFNAQYFYNMGLDRYGGGNGLVATALAYRVHDLGPGATVYFGGVPRMWYYGFQTLPFLARQAKGIDIDRPLTADSPPLPASSHTAFVFLPERAAEVAYVQQWYPGGRLEEVRDKNGAPLFVTYLLP